MGGRKPAKNITDCRCLDQTGEMDGLETAQRFRANGAEELRRLMPCGKLGLCDVKLGVRAVQNSVLELGNAMTISALRLCKMPCWNVS